jgi:hypothetical protein
VRQNGWHLRDQRRSFVVIFVITLVHRRLPRT